MKRHEVIIVVLIFICNAVKGDLMSDSVKGQCLSSCEMEETGNSCKSICDGESILCRHAANNPIEVYLCSKCQFYCVVCCMKKERVYVQHDQWRRRKKYVGNG